MTMAASSASILFHPLPPLLLFNSRNKSFAALLPPSSSNKKKLSSLTSSSVVKLVHLNKSREERWRLVAVPDNFLLISEATPQVEESQLVDSTSGNAGSYIIAVLVFVAFLGLSILTIGVIYIAVTDFLQKREKDKFVKEEAAKKKKGGKKGKIKTRARAGPRGFGQKMEDEYDDDDTE